VIRFVLRRLLSLVPTLLLAVTLVFFLVRLAPGGPFDQERSVPPEVLAALEAKYRLSDPVWVQYKDWLADLVLRGSLGPTFKYPNRTVNEIIALSLPVSVELGLWAMFFALATGIPLGVVGAVRQNRWPDVLATAVALVGLSIPRFVLAPLLVMLFGLTLYWLPVARFDSWRHMVLPVFCAALPMAAHVARLTRAGMLEVVQSDFVRTARAKGLSERSVILRHALRGGLLPVVSYLGPGFSGLLVGSLVIEKIFDIPGMGRYFVEAFQNRDYNLIAGLSIVYGVLLMSSNALVDIAYAWLDPRVELDR
jgi:oligopeptide transport system permease protein